MFWIHQNSPISIGTRGKGFIYNTHTFQTNRDAFSTKDKTVTGQPQSGQSFGYIHIGLVIHSHPFVSMEMFCFAFGHGKDKRDC
jgi:hypothetical protein